jgi:5'-nucleotidase
MPRKFLLALLVIIGMSIVLSGQGYACDVATIEKPEPRQILYFEPVEIMVQFNDGAQPETFRAWLNGNDVTSSFELFENGTRAFVSPDDGLRVYQKGEHGSVYAKGRNLLVTTIKDELGTDDIDARLFFSNEGGYRDTVILTILQTSDLHNHASGYGPFLDYTPLDTTDEDSTYGGYARLASLINQIRNEQASYDIPVLLCDSGDFFMGTIYDLTATDPLVLRFFDLMGYDAITLGNHEFDWSPAGLAMLFGNALSQGFSVPVLATNTITDATNPADDGIEALMATGVIVDKKIVELPNGLKLGLLGQMGPDADAAAPVAPPVTFNHDYSVLQSHVDELRTSDEAQLVVILSHGGIYNDGMGDDADLADNVSGIDIIASGHYHTATQGAFNRSGTIIFSPGKYGEYLSRLDIAYNLSEGSIVDSKFTLIPVDDSILGDPTIHAMVGSYHVAMNASLTPLGVQLDTPISSTSFDLEMAPFQVTGLGGLCADSVRNVANALELLNYPGSPVDLGVVLSGVIRDSIFQGSSGVITFTDVYNCLPLGISPYQTSPPGYPLMHAYLSGLEIYTVCEVGLSLSQVLGPDSYLNFSGIRIDYNPAGAPTFTGVQAVYLCSADDTFCTGDANLIDPTDPDKLYHIVVDLYAFELLNLVAGYGFPVMPKDADGYPIDPEDYIEFRIDVDPAPGVQELKEWMALLNYLPGLGGSIPQEIYGPGGTVMERVNFVD